MFLMLSDGGDNMQLNTESEKILTKVALVYKPQGALRKKCAAACSSEFVV